MLASDHEGKQVAEWLNSLGVSAFVLKYRLGPRYHHPAMLQDAGRAIRTVRALGKKWGVDPHRIAILGFSAGGHLASTAGTHFDAGKPDAEDPVERVSSRPDRLILVYPVIALATPYGHSGSKKNLWAMILRSSWFDRCRTKPRSPRRPRPLSSHTPTRTPASPPKTACCSCWLCAAKVPVEFHLFEKGQHGLGWATAPGSSGSVPTRRSRNGPSSARSGSRARVFSTALVVLRQLHRDRSSRSATERIEPRIQVKEKNRPENQFRTTTSPLVVRHQINWPVSEGSELQRNSPRIQTVSGERASGGSCEASRSPFGGGAVLPEAKQPSPVGWLLISFEATRALLFIVTSLGYSSFVTPCESRNAGRANSMPEIFSLELRPRFSPKSARLSCRSVRIAR